MAISLLSLVLSVYSIIGANREPAIWLSAPDVVRAGFSMTLADEITATINAQPRTWYEVRTGPS